MRFISASEIEAVVDYPSMVDALAEAFGGAFVAPARHHHTMQRPGRVDATHLLMPAWTTKGDFIGVKIANVFPDNAAHGLSAVQAAYVLQSGATGETLAILEGTRLTQLRTAGASALAARHLARKDAHKLLIVGAGSMAPALARAHASQRPIEFIEVWNHRPEGARKLVETLKSEGFKARAAEHLQDAVREADIVSCATLSHAPLISGAWLQPGQHLDLVGAYSLQTREADDIALKRARVFIDTPAAMTEGGDVAIALQSGAIDRSDIVADLAALVQGAPGRGDAGEITLFKSIGAAIEDLAAAMLVYQRIPKA